MSHISKSYSKVRKEDSLGILMPEKARYWSTENPNGSVFEISPKSDYKGIWECSNCGNVWSEKVSDVTKRIRTCLECNATSIGTSFGEQLFFSVFAYLLGDDAVRNRNTKELGFEIDVLIKDYHVGIEYGSWFWHEDKADADRKKIADAVSAGYKLYCIYDCVPPSVKPSQIEHAFVLGEPISFRHPEIIEPIVRAIISDSELPDELNDQKINWERCIRAASQRLVCEPFPALEDSIAAHESLLSEWDYEKNAPVRPEQVSETNSTVLYWWKCPKGHESYESFVSSRRRGVSGCPVCAHKVLAPGQNTLQAEHPEVIEYWDYDANIENPDEIYTSDSRKHVFYWKCPKCGHKWDTTHVKFVLRAEEPCPRCQQEASLMNILEDIDASSGKCRVSFDSMPAGDRNDEDYREHVKAEIIDTVHKHHLAVFADTRYWYIEKPNMFLRIAKITQRGAGHSVREFYRVPDGDVLGNKIYDDYSKAYYFDNVNPDAHKATLERQHQKQPMHPEKTFTNTYPEFLKYWDYDMNAESPDEILPTTNKKKEWYWKCPDCGEHWHTASSQKLVYEKREHCPRCRQVDRLIDALDTIYVGKKTTVLVDGIPCEKTKENDASFGKIARQILRVHRYEIIPDKKGFSLNIDGVFMYVKKATSTRAITSFEISLAIANEYGWSNLEEK